MAYEYSDIFPDVQVRLLTAIEVCVSYPTPPAGDALEYKIGELSPDANLSQVEELFGDGTYVLNGVGMERTESGGLKKNIRDSRTHRVALGKPSTWKERVEAQIREQFPSHFAPPPEPVVDTQPSMDFRNPSPFGGGFHGMDHGFQPPPAAPIVVDMGDGENLVLSAGISAEEQQRRIDEAQKYRREQKDSKTMNDMLMQMMQLQLQNAQAEAKRREEEARQSSERLFAILTGNAGASRGDSSVSDVQIRSLTDVNDQLRRQLRDMEEQHRKDRNDHWTETNEWKRRCADIEDQLREERRKNNDLTAKLAKADIDAMMAGKVPGAGDNDEEKMQRKVAMFAQLAQSLAPVAAPILQKMGILGGPPGAEAPTAAIQSGDLMSTGGTFGGEGSQSQ